jgi:predicted nucleotidyltransferase
LTFGFSEWRDDATWQQRLAADQAALAARLSTDQRQVLDEIAGALGAGDAGDVLALDFMVVFGSYARGEQGPNSDVDIYYEANLPEPMNRVDANRHYQLFGMARGALADELRDGRDFGRGVVVDALVVHDNGSFRRLLIFVDEGRTANL